MPEGLPPNIALFKIAYRLLSGTFMKAFRYDINALRALSVLAVVIYHFYPNYAPGGFVGVDVFFVISGFLMTQIMHQPKVSLKKFYFNRVNRILPALCVMLVIVSLVASIFVSIFDLKNLSLHALHSLSFISNITYMNEVNYFDSGALEKWFLHTWSLSVEWQFYLIYPLILLAIYRLKPDINMRNVLISGTVLSFTINLLIASSTPHKAYYLLTTRAWEMTLGGVVFFLQKELSSRTANLMLAIGITLIVTSIFVLNNVTTVWPGYLALIPTTGAALALLANSNSQLLKLPLLTSLGNWSYSIYLWHWPLAVAIATFNTPHYAPMAIVISIVVGAFSYKFIEVHKKTKYTFTLFTFALLITGSLYQYSNYIIENRPEKIKNLILGHNYLTEGVRHYNSGETLFHTSDIKNTDYLLIGDSNSAHYSWGISSVSKLKIASQWAGSCLPFEDINTKADPLSGWMNENWKNQCYSLHEHIYDNPEADVIIALSWGERELTCTSGACDSLNNNNYLDNIREQIEKLSNLLPERNLILIGQLPVPKDDIYMCLKRYGSDCPSATSEIQDGRKEMNAFLETIAEKRSNVFLINPFNAVCNSENYCKVESNGQSYYYDRSHVSGLGSEVFWQYIEKELNKLPH
ncbi:O-antigen acetylase [Vibrio maritimus]|uniref:O-antigen acetylase n=1 Tax=Vibrio maritimus TaxID=990268 RepID=A0A090SRX3_9VIBR|nr:O-antigen acetylase [Vibrio maritimus]